MARSIFLVPGLILSLSACAQIPAPVAGTAQARCDAGKASGAVGQLPTPETQERARTRAGAEVVRVLRHNQPITKEFRVGRLNLALNAEGRIASVNCG
jgi:hypothetical protein